ncbi:flagellar hook-basal body complex subunit FliE [Neobacillus bataviensis LMG 21833]|uniref:Flagellar hook-basal body complex protein FliE n=1 Tax=Neobacillus bataviensis LMG 21833 TaxID=1117379 RepID=K6DSC1_9BACI|nr:flagellar hook-basal body complex protein FliE [Neobacillus bataviensis]EKN63686.1 flagellar hook-basal body complex subunit FliE [Neobacillus bataviensis LMG 21833]
MKVDQLFTTPSVFFGKNQQVQAASPSKTSFSEALGEALQSANETILQSENMSAKIATGEIKNIHDVTIAAQKAQIALQLTTQVRDKVVESYQEIMRMQV